jgi:septum formation protein
LSGNPLLGKEVVLASASVRRKSLLEGMGLKVKVIPADIDERNVGAGNPEELVRKLALSKAEYVASRLDEGLVIGADTVVVLGNEVIGKPEDKVHASQILQKLSGTEHRVISGIAVCDVRSGVKLTDVDISSVKMRELSDEEVEEHSVLHLDKAGGYAVQEDGDNFIERVEGSFYNVVGLPVEKLRNMLLAIIGKK